MILRLFILCGILYGNTVYSQNCLDEINKLVPYSNSNDIINGIRWIYEKKYLGSPMLVENYWPKTVLRFDGVLYKDILMNYNVFNNEIIIYHAERGKEKYVVINRDKLSGFTFTDTVSNRKHVFEYIELPGIRGKALYENAFVGKTRLYIKPIKRIDIKYSEKGQGEFINYYEYYLKTGNVFTSFQSKAQFIKLLADHNTEVKRFIHKKKLKINPRYPENVILVLNFFEGLE